MEQRTNTSVARNVGKKLLVAAILSAGLALSGAVQASAHPINPPRMMTAYYQPVVVLVRTPPRHHFRPHYRLPHHHFRPHYWPPRYHLYYRAWR